MSDTDWASTRRVAAGEERVPLDAGAVQVLSFMFRHPLGCDVTVSRDEFRVAFPNTTGKYFPKNAPRALSFVLELFGKVGGVSSGFVGTIAAGRVDRVDGHPGFEHGAVHVWADSDEKAVRLWLRTPRCLGVGVAPPSEPPPLGAAAPMSRVEAAAWRLHYAERVLFSTGAGMSAESGVPTYREEGGRWRNLEPFHSRGLAPQDFAHPPGFRDQPHLAWSYYSHMRDVVLNAEPHDGYAVITRWLARFADSFLLTTNIDELHLRAGVPHERVWQRYGSMFELQCLQPCKKSVWRDERASLCTVDEASLHARDFPTCPSCGGAARPRTQMALDEDYIEDDAAAARFQRFKDPGEPDVVVVVGTTLWFSWPKSVQPQPTVISINPDPGAHEPYGDSCISVTGRASDALVAIDGALRLVT